ncbi:MAG: cobalt-precorrin-5B (C(1))-methyltransferase CbiD [Verrucomicrobiales bacterium]|nr:cobalt-precorrin-5B (C(1))-methyltransferase CbiD [Verrucomicrobiota bacterium JB025]
MILRSGYTTGACAAAAAKAAAMCLCDGSAPTQVEIALPEGTRVWFPVVDCGPIDGGARASVRKDAGDDPDVTHQSLIVVTVSYVEGGEILFAAGEGVGTVTKPGLSIPPGEPAINPVPRRMIREALREVTPLGLRVTVSIPGGRELAERTFNPRLGIEGGLSIIGTIGIVKPFSAPALTASLQCGLDVAAASGVRAPVLVPGNIGERAALKNLRLDPGQIIQVSNHWGFMLSQAAIEARFTDLLVMGHPGKLAKLTDGEWDTHSSSSASAVGAVVRIGRGLLDESAAESTTVEGIFAACDAERAARLGDALAAAVHAAITGRIGPAKGLAVVLVNLAGDILGTHGELTLWK